MFAICEVREFAGSFSRPQRIGAGRIRRKLVFVVALLLMIGVGGQVARAAEGDVSPTPHPSEPPHPSMTPHPSEPPHPSMTPHPSEPPHPSMTPHPSEPLIPPRRLILPSRPIL